jgi:hypothetical protein
MQHIRISHLIFNSKFGHIFADHELTVSEARIKAENYPQLPRTSATSSFLVGYPIE